MLINVTLLQSVTSIFPWTVWLQATFYLPFINSCKQLFVYSTLGKHGPLPAHLKSNPIKYACWLVWVFFFFQFPLSQTENLHRFTVKYGFETDCHSGFVISLFWALISSHPLCEFYILLLCVLQRLRSFRLVQPGSGLLSFVQINIRLSSCGDACDTASPLHHALA